MVQMLHTISCNFVVHSVLIVLSSKSVCFLLYFLISELVQIKFGRGG